MVCEPYSITHSNGDAVFLVETDEAEELPISILMVQECGIATVEACRRQGG